MSDLPVSATTTGAVIFWISAFALAGTYSVIGTRGLGVFAILCAAAGATLTVRRYLINLADELREREHNAFQIGIDAQRIKRVH